MQYTSQFQLQASTVVLDLLITSPLVISVMCVCETVKCGRLYNSSSSGSVKKGKNLVLLQVHWDWIKEILMEFCQSYPGNLQDKQSFSVHGETTCLGTHSPLFSVKWSKSHSVDSIPPHTKLLYVCKFGFALGLDSMQGREAKHVKLAKYAENTCNVRKSTRWWTVFHHEFVSLWWLREMYPFSVS